MAKKETTNFASRNPQSGDKLWGSNAAEDEAYEYPVEKLVSFPSFEGDDSRLGGNTIYLATPLITGFSTSYGITSNYVRGVVTYVREIAWSEVSINVATAGSGSDEIYVMAFNLDASGMPTTVAAEWGPFDVTSTGLVTLTGQTETLAAGHYYWCYWAGTMAGSPTVTTIVSSSFVAAYDTGAVGDLNDSGNTTKPTDLSAETFNAAGGHFAPFMSGHD